MRAVFLASARKERGNCGTRDCRTACPEEPESRSAQSRLEGFRYNRGKKVRRLARVIRPLSAFRVTHLLRRRNENSPPPVGKLHDGFLGLRRYRMRRMAAAGRDSVRTNRIAAGTETRNHARQL